MFEGVWKIGVVGIVGIFIMVWYMAEPSPNPATPIKKDESGACHPPMISPYSWYILHDNYERTHGVAFFKTLDECLKSGGRLPFFIPKQCTDGSTSFKTLDECLKSGGRLPKG